MNLFALSHDAVYQLVRAIMAGAAIAGLVWTRRPLPTLRCPRYLIEIGGVAAFMLWFSERTWVHHYVSFLLTLCAAGAILSDPAQPDRARRLVRRALIVFSFATCFASEAGRLLGPDGVDWAKGVGVFLWPSLFVTIAVIRSVERTSPSRAGDGAATTFQVLPVAGHPRALRAAGRIAPSASNCLISGHSRTNLPDVV